MVGDTSSRPNVRAIALEFESDRRKLMIRVWVRVRIWDRVRVIVRVIVTVRVRVSKELGSG